MCSLESIRVAPSGPVGEGFVLSLLSCPAVSSTADGDKGFLFTAGSTLGEHHPRDHSWLLSMCGVSMGGVGCP